MLKPFFAAHGPDWSGFAVNDCGPHRLHRGRVREVAVGVKVADRFVDPDRIKHRGHRPGHELTHRKDRPAHPERRQNVEHVRVGGFIDLKPFAGIDGRLVAIKAVGAHRVPVEHPEHVGALGHAVEYFAGKGYRGHQLDPFGGFGPKAAQVDSTSPSSSVLHDPFRAAGLVSGRVKGRRMPGEASLDAAGAHAAGLVIPFGLPFPFFPLPVLENLVPILRRRT